jgi:PAS domain S-box-containing protein
MTEIALIAPAAKMHNLSDLDDYSQEERMAKLRDVRLDLIQIVNASLDAAVIIDFDYIVISANQAFERLFGIPPVKISGTSLRQCLIAPEFQSQVRHICDAVSSGETVRLNTERWRTNGQAVPVCLTAYPIRNAQSIIFIYVVYQDLSERLRTEKILSEHEKRLQDFVHAFSDASVIIDEDGKLLEAFGDFRVVLSQAGPKIEGESIQGLFPDVAEVFLRAVAKTITSGIPQQTIREMEIQDRCKIIEIRFVPLKHAVNRRKTVGIIFTDITNRRQMAHKLYSAYELQRRSDLLNNIILGNKSITVTELTDVLKLGIDFAVSMFCCLLRSEAYFDSTAQTAASRECCNPKYTLIDFLGNDSEFIAWDCREDIGVLCIMKGRTGETEAIDRLKEKLRHFQPDLKVIIGVGDTQTGPDGLKLSYKQACCSILSANCRDTDPEKIQVFYYRDLGLLKFLINYCEGKYVEEFIDETIGELVKYDQRRGTDLLNTLEAIIQSFTIQAAAEQTFLHPKSVYYRKRRIEKILGYSLDSMDRRYAIALALNLLKIKHNPIDNFL